ncbi:MAG: AAA family ATPase [Cyanobacteria bacterium RI_101]|nr:AAA family ATPase [Cyanobacteria bacterium RI_101]
MNRPHPSLLIGSIEPYSGKTGVILGLGRQLQAQGLTLAYGKPLGTCFNGGSEEADIAFIGQTLNLASERIRSPLLLLDEPSIRRRLGGEDERDYLQALRQSLETLTADLVLLEGPGNLWEGSLFGLSFLSLAKSLALPILLVARYHSPLVVDALLKARQELGDCLAGVVINDIPPERREEVETLVKPFLEKSGIAVLGLLPQDRLLQSVSVRELAHQLQAQVLCRGDRLDLMVEGLTIGAMNVNSALEYFRQGENKAVVTGGDRTDLQLAALETSTSCLILTGHMPPQPLIISRAEDLEIPILSVDLDTLTTVEIVDRAFGAVRLQETVKVDCIQNLMAKHFDLLRLLTYLGLGDRR